MNASPLLIDGPLMPLQRYREDLVRRMAEDLVRLDAYRSPIEAARVLFETHKYKMRDIMVLVDDARQVAAQPDVAKEMSDG